MYRIHPLIAGCDTWGMKVRLGIPEPKNVNIILVVTVVGWGVDPIYS